MKQLESSGKHCHNTACDAHGEAKTIDMTIGNWVQMLSKKITLFLNVLESQEPRHNGRQEPSDTRNKA